MAGVGGWHVEITNLREVFDTLEEMDKKASKAVIKGITTAGKQVAVEASYLSPSQRPLSNWGPWKFSRDGRDLSYDASVVASSFKLIRNNFRRRGVSAGIAWDVQQGNAGGAIWEVIGDGSRVTTPAGQHLVDVINARFPRKQPRVLMAAYYRVMSPELREQIRDSIIAEAHRLGLK